MNLSLRRFGSRQFLCNVYHVLMYPTALRLRFPVINFDNSPFI